MNHHHQSRGSLPRPPVPILYEDNHLYVLIKPAGLLSQADASGDPDLVTRMKAYRKEKEHKPGEAYIGLVHRLDRPVGGLMVLAKTSKGAARLSQAIREGEFEKYYLAVTTGCPKQKTGTLTHTLWKDPRTHHVFRVPDTTPGGRRAALKYEVLDTMIPKDQSETSLALIHIHLITGRSHQIRVQFQSIGHPLWGDQRYGETFRVTAKTNPALWAYALRFPHPTLRTPLYFTAPPPSVPPWSFFKFHQMLPHPNVTGPAAQDLHVPDPDSR
ncbi:MAG: RluA family pseudouridine synthase [Candidatus Carbobacillus altaicus]|nr:RluA family pseudouridine synthase [Candidatus Carbobacillus altaicus]